MSVYDHPSTRQLAAREPPPGVRQHLERCVACRARAARLSHDLMPGAPSEDAIARVLAASTPAAPIISSFSPTRDGAPPRPGEIWRAGRDEALLVWVRRVLSGAIDVLPVVLDTGLADQESLLLPAEATPLALPLALLTGIRGHVGPRAMLQRIGYAHVFASVKEVMEAARAGRRPIGVAVGPPIDDGDDQRAEYRQVIADLLADLAPDAEADEGPPGGELAAITALLSGELSFWDAGARVAPLPPHTEPAGDEAALYPCARVTYLDTSIVVALLAGAGGSPWGDAAGVGPLLAACRALARLAPDAAAIAVVGNEPGWPAVVVRAGELPDAYEAPTGRVTGPTLTAEPLPVVHAVAKFLDSRLPAWEVTEPVSPRVPGVDIHASAEASAERAVAEVTAAGRRSKTAAKRSAWTSLPGDLAARLADAIAAIGAGEPAADVLDGLTGPGDGQ